MMTDAWGALDAEAAQALLRGLPTPMLLVDAAGIVVAANDGAADLLGLRCADLVGAP
jgi:PAS domain-containing protein